MASEFDWNPRLEEAKLLPVSFVSQKRKRLSEAEAIDQMKTKSGDESATGLCLVLYFFFFFESSYWYHEN